MKTGAIRIANNMLTALRHSHYSFNHEHGIRPRNYFGHSVIHSPPAMLDTEVLDTERNTIGIQISVLSTQNI